MRHLFRAITRQLQTGRLFPWVLCLLAALFFVGDALLHPDRFYTSLFFAFFGCTAAWYHYVVWRRKRAQGGLDLIGTYDAPRYD
ncbi:MAG: hypothetical protein GVY15_08465 [Bacteroidetes bacterium]|jgi:hypothetical protein|nr:hypothetical protein [Bacteroidota bacterium]